MSLKSRGQWKRWSEFMLSCFACVIGLGTIWRFPYICFKNGGGAFMIPYVIFMVLTALPVILAELSYSQYSNLSPVKIWSCCPLFKGIGYGMVILTGIVTLHYNVIPAWSLFYLGNSFFPTIPWSNCQGNWNTVNCYVRGTSPVNQSDIDDLDGNLTGSVSSSVRKTAAEEFWENHVLQVTDGFGSPGSVRWQLLLCLFAAWLLTFLCVLKGLRASGKVTYVVSIVPFVFLIILLIRGLTLPGAIDGLEYYVIPRWNDLTKFSVWVDAAVQVAYSSDIAKGGFQTLASYSNFHNNCYRDALVLPVVNIVTNWIIGCVIFVTLGSMAKDLNVDIAEVVKDGPGIAFMAYPEALSKLPLPQLWSVLFFLMFFTFGLHSQMVHIQTLTGAMIDTFPKLDSRRTTLTSIVCTCGFLLGIPCITQGGIYLLTLIDWYCASVTIMILSLLEITLLAWVYGAERLLNDIEMMIGYKPHAIWKFMWKVMSPCSLFFVWIVHLVRHESVRYGDYQYPLGAVALGWIIGVTPLVSIPVGMVHTISKMDGKFIDRLKKAIKPSPKWKPAIEKVAEEPAQITITHM